jgi:hypothetical protein
MDSLAPCTVTARGGSLILEYQKSAPTPSGHSANDRVVQRPKLRQFGSTLECVYSHQRERSGRFGRLTISGTPV